ncbi:MAG: type II toxin-antitoxin system RelE/ParE family toxin [Armatimonadetes bacterium]|nr:type II toxin-antitoxin system RelE/ParE family toxin [Armatimonadota bacterium]
MEFEIVLYTDAAGNSPVDEFLDDLRIRQPHLHNVTESGIRKLQRRMNHHEPITKHVGEGLYELRCGHKDITRVLWFFFAGAKIVLVHGLVKKTDRIPAADMIMALARKADYLRRHTESSLERRHG